MTSSVDFRHRVIDTFDWRCKLQVWDCLSTPSNEMMRSIYRGATVIVLMYDITNIDALSSAAEWTSEVRLYAGPKVMLYLVGSKIDQSDKRKVTVKEGETAAANLRAKAYFEVSSKTGAVVEELFNRIVSDLQDRSEEESMRSSLSSFFMPRSSASLFGDDEKEADIARLREERECGCRCTCCTIS